MQSTFDVSRAERENEEKKETKLNDFFSSSFISKVCVCTLVRQIQGRRCSRMFVHTTGASYIIHAIRSDEGWCLGERMGGWVLWSRVAMLEVEGTNLNQESEIMPVH